MTQEFREEHNVADLRTMTLGYEVLYPQTFHGVLSLQATEI